MKVLGWIFLGILMLAAGCLITLVVLLVTDEIDEVKWRKEHWK